MSEFSIISVRETGENIDNPSSMMITSIRKSLVS